MSKRARFGRSRRRVMLALALAGLVLAVVLLLLTRSNGQNGDPRVAPVSQTSEAGDLRVTLQLDRAELGSRAIDVFVGGEGAPSAVRAVQLRFSMAEMDMGRIEAEAQPVREGQFRAQGQFFSMAGRWTVETILLRDGKPPLRVPFDLAIAAPGEASGPLNPLPADAQTLSAGRLLYQANCVVCHGASGRGDGPAALTLNPRPSDFTQHMLAGKHTDGQVFLWIQDGFPGTAMPAWGQRLSEPQIWQLVTYLRTFAPAPVSTTSAPSAGATAEPTAAPVVQESLPPLIFARQGNLWRSDGGPNPPRPITSLEAGSYAEYPALAPDGSRIAFITTSQAPITDSTPLPLPIPKTQLHVMRADGTEQRMLWAPERGVLGLITWAPDGQALYVGFADVRSAPGAPVADRLFQVIRVDPQSGAQQVALEDARDPAFARDGQIAYLRWHKDLSAFTLNVAAPDGRDERELTKWSAFPDLYAPRFSPDGRRIIFMSTGGPPTDEQGNPLVGNAASALDRLLGWLAPPVAEAHGAPWDLWSINADGSGLRRLTNLHEDTPMAVFAPDGRQIALMGAGGIYLLDADGGQVRKLDPLGDHGGLDWDAR